MTRKFSKKLFGGLTAVMATALSLSVGLTSLAIQWEPLVNQALGITISNTVTGGNENIDTLYYKSQFGDITAMYKSNPTAEETAALDAAQKELVAAEKAYSIREQEEGSVLLKNGNVNGKAALPLADNERKVTLFGNSAAHSHFVYRTDAAGPNPRQAAQLIKFPQAFKDAGFTINDTVLNALESSGVERNRGTAGQSTIGEVPVTFYNSYTNTFSEYSDAAIVVFSRMAGEGIDLNTRDSSGISQLALHQEEADLLKMIKNLGVFKKTIVLLNSANSMETGFLFEEQYGVDACLWIGEPTMYGCAGVVNLLTGKANPSGRLTDTYAANSLSAPAVQNFGNMSYTNNNSYKYIVESEGIYVGYKYYETRYEDTVYGRYGANSAKGSSTSSAWNYADEIVFPFGYGASYTTFGQTLDSVEYNSETDSYTVTVTVTNTGAAAGKDVVQVYAQTPYNPADGIEKSAVQLVGFNKTLGKHADGSDETADISDRETGLLQPGESEVVTVEVDRYLLASYSVAARSGKGGYVLTAGDYYLAIGNNSHDALNNILAKKGAENLTDENGTAVAGNADKVVLLENTGSALDETTYSKSRYTEATVGNQLERADINYWQKNSVKYLSRSDWDGTFPDTVSLTLSDDMKKEMDGGTYKANASTAPAKGTYKQEQSNGISFIDMKDVPWSGTYTDKDGNEKNADEMWEKFLNQLSVEELARATTSNAAKGATAVNAPRTQVGDGPSGVGGSLPNGTTSTSYPSAVVAASTFNPKALSIRGDLLAEDGIYTGVHMLWGPGTNLHRTPFSGRNFEYYSEDANMNYICGALEIKAMNSRGMAAAIKHFAGNNQETNRAGVATFNNEQAWREGSLRGFEGAIGKSSSLAVMTSFNLIGCTPSVSCYATNVSVMKDEWGFHGINITDASSGQPYMNSVNSIINGTTMYCLDNREADLKKECGRSYYDDILAALRLANKQYYYVMVRTHAVNGIAPGATVQSQQVWWKGALIAIEVVLGILTGISAAAYVYFGYFMKEKKETAHE